MKIFFGKSKQKPLSAQYISIGGNMLELEKMDEGREGIGGTFGTPDNHVYLLISQSMRGTVRFDVSVNYPTLDESRKVLSEAVDVVQRIIAEKVLPVEGRR
jgi:hypothetical protein